MYDDAIYTPEYWESRIAERERHIGEDPLEYHERYKGEDNWKSRSKKQREEADCWTCKYYENWSCLADELNAPSCSGSKFCQQWERRPVHRDYY